MGGYNAFWGQILLLALPKAFARPELWTFREVQLPCHNFTKLTESIAQPFQWQSNHSLLWSVTPGYRAPIQSLHYLELKGVKYHKIIHQNEMCVTSKNSEADNYCTQQKIKII